MPPEIRDAFVRAYTGCEALRCGFGYYRVAAQNAAAIPAAGRLTVPTIALGGNTVGNLLHQQLASVTDDLAGEIVPRSGRLVPLDRPDAVAELLLDAVRPRPTSPARPAAAPIRQ